MYSNDDLNSAVEAGVFSSETAEQFRQHVAAQRNTPTADEENFRLITGFNDIFVAIACGLVLVCGVWISNDAGAAFGGITLAILSWLLAEFFVARRRMALPAIMLLGSFLGGVFYAVVESVSMQQDGEVWVAALVCCIGAALHWLRFRVPITIAGGTGALCLTIIGIVLSQFPQFEDYAKALIFLLGIAVFAFAMWWDSKDPQRVNFRSDVAFWLHLLASPMMVHSVFTSFGIIDGSAGAAGTTAVLGLYLFLGLVSLAIDRRAMLVSALGYVLYTLSETFESYGAVDLSFAFTGLLVGVMLLLLSVFWQPLRRAVLRLFPASVTAVLPPIR